MWIEFISSKFACIARVTSSVAFSQISINSWRRSSSVSRPREYCDSTLSASFSWRSRIFAFSGGTATSSIANVTPERVAHVNESDFIRSSVVDITTLS